MQNSFSTHEGSTIRFEWKPLQNNYKSQQAGTQVFDDALIGYVSAPGQSKSEVAHEFLRKSKEGVETRKSPSAWERYGEQAEKFLSGRPDYSGTPIDQLPDATPTVIAQLKLLNIFTVEQLANLSDIGLQNVGMGARDLKAKAIWYVENASNEAANAAAKEATDKVEELEKKLAELQAQLEKPKKRKSGK